ncbi:MAG: flagellar export chaperone FlgN [Bacillota bacterium]
MNIYQQEYSRYQNILELTKKELEFIEQEDYDGLNVLLKKKSDIISEINQREKKIFTIKDSLAQKLNIKNDQHFIVNLLKYNDLPKKNELGEIVNSIYQILEKITQLTVEHQNKIKQDQQALIKNINEVQKGLDVNNSYNSQIDSYEGKYFDQKK